MTFSTQQNGYSLVEVLVAVAVLLLTIVGPLTIASKGLKNASTAKQQTVAFFLAQEGIEGVVRAREDAALDVFVGGSSDVWDTVEQLNLLGCEADSPCGVDVENDSSLFRCSDQTCDIFLTENGRAHYSHDVTGATTPYRREIIFNADSERAYVQSIVSWGEASDERVALSMYLYNIYEN